ncbi:glycosyltransferase [filamentous cyanobacterium LEGE 11480]|uniref:Glycosyltransferase n=1 Tax=Romeriopsis navalis LEGE 11480 TaxID=2777977 RepID=A0A928VJQ4_9CYAN|nr:glycosyltransferase [Romeriopsis navalis]MBE9028902.1 glycosyltransferase [Romeriopsis navalis LEGE 11480]
MKVLIVIPYIGSVYGGTSKSVSELANGLGSLGIQVDLITTNANGPDKLDVPLKTWIEHQSYRIKYFPCWHRYDQTFSPSLLYWTFRHLHEYDLVHSHTLFSPMLLSIVHWQCRLKQMPYLMSPHGMLEPWALHNKANKKRRYFQYVEQPALQHAQALQVLTAAEANNLHQLNLLRTVQVPNGIDQHLFTALPEPEAFYQAFPSTRGKRILLFLSRIDAKKGLDLLASAFAQVHQNFPDLHLVIAGPNSTGFLPTVENYFAELGCLDSVTFTGMLNGDLKYAALAAAELYILPSYSEGFSMSVLEGMAAGLPCIITTGCNFPEAQEADAACVVDINAEAIVTALKDCLESPQQAADMGMRGQQLILQNYTWEQSASKLLQVYTSIVDAETSNKSLSHV